MLQVGHGRSTGTFRCHVGAAVRRQRQRLRAVGEKRRKYELRLAGQLRHGHLLLQWTSVLSVSYNVYLDLHRDEIVD